MRLLLRLSTLRKAGKVGLVAVKKQVTKKGKTFSQTFYVKPDSVPKAPNGPTPVTGLEKQPQKILLMRGDNSYELESNRPEGGFFMQNAEKAVRVPEKYIVKVIKRIGHTFVIHRALGKYSLDDERLMWKSDYVMTEVNTGLRLTQPEDTIEKTESAGLDILGKHIKEDIDRLIENNKSIKELEPWMNTEDWKAEEPKRVISFEERQIFAESIWKEYLDAEDGPVTLQQVDDWVRDIEGINYNTDLNEAREQITTKDILEEAIVEKLPYVTSEIRLKGLYEIIALANESEMAEAGVASVDYVTVVEWARKHEGNLVDGFNSIKYGTSYDSGEEAWTAADVVAYAIESEISLGNAQATAEERTAEIDEEEKAEERKEMQNMEFTDPEGKTWNWDDLHSIGAWVGGKVKSTREAAKALDEMLRGDKHVSIIDDIVDVVNKHASVYNDILYRGTGNRAWLESEVGDILPVGMASFSKNMLKAKGFSETVLLILEESAGTLDDPVIGIDVNEVVADGENAGFENAVAESGIAGYDYEEEFIVRAPAFEIIRRVGNQVFVKPREMSLLEMMKSLFADRIKEMERTFDYSLHREPEDAWT